MGIQFELSASDSTNTIESGGSVLLTAIVTLFGEARHVNLSVTCDPSAGLTTNVSTRLLELAAFEQRVESIRVRAKASLVDNAMVWVQVAVNDVESSSSRVQRVYLYTRRKPPPSTPPTRRPTTTRPLTTTRPRRPSGQTPSLTQVGGSRAENEKPVDTRAAPTTSPLPPVPDLEEPKCRVESANYANACANANVSACDGEQWQWDAAFVFWDEPRASGRVESVRLFMKSSARTNDEKRRVELAVHNSKHSSWRSDSRRGSGGDRDPNQKHTYSVRASCCVYEIRLRVADPNGLEAECRVPTRISYANRHTVQSTLYTRAVH